MRNVRRAVCLFVVSICLAPGDAGAQAVHGVGSVGATTGASAARGATGRPTGAKLGDAPLATVPLFNDANNCGDTDAECRLYWVAQQRADPEIAYDGAFMVRIPTELAVIMIPEQSRDLMTCDDPGGKPVYWRDVVERGRTVAQVVGDAQSKMYSLTAEATARSRPYRLLWCPTTGGSPKPLGQSWRVRVTR